MKLKTASKVSVEKKREVAEGSAREEEKNDVSVSVGSQTRLSTQQDQVGGEGEKSRRAT